MKKGKYLIFSVIAFVLCFFPIIGAKALSANITVNSNSTVTVGKKFTVNITVSSSSKISGYDYTLDYDSSNLTLVSGGTAINWADKPTKSSTKSFTFKSRDEGESTITVKNYSVTLEDGSLVNNKNIKLSSKTITTKEDDDINNTFLKSLSVKEGKISPKFDKKTIDYKLKVEENVDFVNINAEAEASSSTVTGTGKVEVEEGVNNLEVIVKAKSGAIKKYYIVVEIEDKDPIMVTVNGKKYTVVKSSKTMEKMCPENYTLEEIEIDGKDVPVCYNDTTDFTLVGLKSDDNKVRLYIYDEDKNKYSFYNELKSNELFLLPLIPEDKLIPDDYEKTTLTINDNKTTVYKNGSNNKYYLIYAMNLNTGKKGWYSYEPNENTFQKYYSYKLEDKDSIIIVTLGVLLVISLIGNIVALSKKKKKNKAS